MMMTPLFIVLGIGAVMLAAIILVLILAAMKPNEFRVARSIEIAAPAGKIFPLLEDPRAQQRWSPFEQKDPDMKRVYSGAERGVGAIYEWDGDRTIGAGRQEITSVAPDDKVEGKIDFFRPMQANHRFEFVLQAAANGTRVTWATFGPMPFVSKVMTVFTSLDNMIGSEFEKGLVELKALAEK